jgi:hypothetical protein
LKHLRFCLSFFVVASVAYPAIIYSDFDPTNFIVQGGWGVYDTNNKAEPGAFNAVAMGFTPSFTASLTNINVGMGWLSGTNSLVLSLDADQSGAPGAVIASWTLNNLPSFGSCCAASTLFAASPIPLTAGNRYWVVAFPGGSDTDVIWTNVNSLGPIAEQFPSGAPWISDTSVQSAFQVNGIADAGTATPEPISCFLVVAGLALIAGCRACSRFDMSKCPPDTHR